MNTPSLRLKLQTRILFALLVVGVICSSMGMIVLVCLEPGLKISQFGGDLVLIILVSLSLSFLAYRFISFSMKSLGEVSATFGATVSQVYTAAQKTMLISQNLSASSNMQASSLQQAISSLEEISSTIDGNSQRSQNSKSLSERNKQIALHGKKSVQGVGESIQRLEGSVSKIINQSESTQQEINSIAEIIQSIGSKTQVINDIVFQTKLLSFNASVESARAGEHGKGFSVVAEQIGHLAQMSGHAANEISALLDSSTKRVHQIITSSKAKIDELVKDNKNNLHESQQNVDQCRQILDEIVQNAIDLSQQVGAISEATTEQSLGLREISNSVATLESVTQKNNLLAIESSSTGTYLADQASVLNQSVDVLILTVKGRVEPKLGVQMLKERLLNKGKPHLGPMRSLFKVSVPDLMFGSESIVNQFEIVDGLKGEFGGNATVFVKSGDEFIRVSTNVMNKDGSRALGTPLAKNPAYEAISRGLSFSGDLLILENLYETCYEPIFKEGEVIGIYYFGNKKTSD